MLSSSESNSRYNGFNPDIPIVDLIYKKKLTEEDQSKEDESVLYFTSRDKFIQKGIELELIWDEDQELYPIPNERSSLDTSN